VVIIFVSEHGGLLTQLEISDCKWHTYPIWIKIVSLPFTSRRTDINNNRYGFWFFFLCCII